jgi:hypothetical protein
MLGNAREWTSSPYVDLVDGNSSPQLATFCTCGGGWLMEPPHVEKYGLNLLSRNPIGSDSLGFRCALTAVP